MPATLSTLASPPEESATARILATAGRHLFTYGYNALTMDDLAHELGMSKKTLYLHFPGKDAIIGTIIDGIGRTIRAEMEAVLNDPGLSFVQKLRAVIDVVAPRLAQTSPAMLRELQRYAPRIHRKIDELRQKNIPYVFGRLLRQGQAARMVRADLDPDFAVEFWRPAIQALMHPDTLERLQLSPDEIFRRAINLFFGGILTPAGRKDYEKHLPV